MKMLNIFCKQYLPSLLVSLYMETKINKISQVICTFSVLSCYHELNNNSYWQWQPHRLECSAMNYSSAEENQTNRQLFWYMHLCVYTGPSGRPSILMLKSIKFLADIQVASASIQPEPNTTLCRLSCGRSNDRPLSSSASLGGNATWWCLRKATSGKAISAWHDPRT